MKRSVGTVARPRSRRSLKTRGIRLRYVLDEGSVVTDGIVPGLARPAALIGIAEKGFVSLELSAVAPAGHSSMPPPQTAMGIVAAAVRAWKTTRCRRRWTDRPRSCLTAFTPKCLS